MITFLLTPGQESDIEQAEPLMQTGAIRRGSGQRRLRPERLVADTGYTMLLFESIFIAIIFVVRLLGAATRDVDVPSTNSTTERGISLNVSSTSSNNFGALPLATKNELPTSQR
jgi:hypothetical protein